jgi:hypothetical protein
MFLKGIVLGTMFTVSASLIINPESLTSSENMLRIPGVCGSG